MPPLPTVDSIAADLFTRLPSDVLADLREEDPGTAVELHFGPVRLEPLPAQKINSGDCSTDGYYEAEFDPAQPWIIYAEDVAPSRRRFTILHELGHHLLATDACDLLDQVDTVGGSAPGAIRAEEAVCHQLAGRILVPEDLVLDTIGSDRPQPHHIAEIKRSCGASWPATAIQVARLLAEPAAIVMVEQGGVVQFATSSRRLGFDWWAAGSVTDPHGPMHTAAERPHRAVKDTYRYAQAFARQMYCDSAPVADGLAVAVLTDKPSDGHFDILEESEPVWKERLLYCEHCKGDRDSGWCDLCRGPLCRDCGRCACQRPIKNPSCTACGIRKPHRAGAAICRDCEADLGM